MEMNYCRRCGAALSRADNSNMYRCESGHTIFFNIASSVGVFLLDTEGKLLLSVRGIEPRKGMLDAFGGFLDGKETHVEALVREMREELGLAPSDYTEPIYLTSAIGQYPYGGETLPVLSSIYYATLFPHASPNASDDVASIRTVSIAELDPALLHDDDVREGLRVLKQVL